MKFPKNKQRHFLIDFKSMIGLSWPEFARILEINRTTLEKSYRYEYCNLPFSIFHKICVITNISEREVMQFYGAKQVDYIPNLIIGRKIFGENRTKLPEINIGFKNLIPYFDVSEIELNKYDKLKNLKFPEELTPELAEEIGIHIGDGFLSKRKNEYRLKGDKRERDYYEYIGKLYKNLFNLDLNIRDYSDTHGFEITSKGLWEFKNKILGIPAGRKDNIELPDIIRVNDVKILTSFIRGVFDTDGNVYFRTNYGFKRYYPIIQVALLSKELIFGIAEILSMLGFDPYIFEEKGGCWHIYLNGYERMKKYSQLIGWNNPKHLNKVKEWKETYPELSKGVKI